MFEKQKYPIIGSTSLIEISYSHSLRFDSKQTEQRFKQLDALLHSTPTTYLGKFLPNPVVKGIQPTYLQEGEGVPVINTLSIQNMSINVGSCRHISEDDFEFISESRSLQYNDVLLTMDGGTSIGKPVLFELDGDYTVDSHVAILRPEGLSPQALLYFLASPVGQLQFQRFESGASGQTAVTEEDLRRFLIPISAIEKLESAVDKITQERQRIAAEREELNNSENKMWDSFTKDIFS